MNFRSLFSFGVACITSPCCTPLIVPLIVGLLAGTPAALWITQHLGLVYGGLTLISVLSFVLGWRWLRGRKPAAPTLVRPIDIPILSDSKPTDFNLEINNHVE